MSRVKILLIAFVVLLMGVFPKEIDYIYAENKDPILIGGYDFSTVVFENEDIWSWGANNVGQLGIGNNENQLHPVRVNNTTLKEDGLKKMISVDNTMIALTEKGNVYLWGSLIQNVSSIQNKPTKITTGNTKDISLAWTPRETNNHRSIGLLEDGKVYVLGSGFQGQFGNGLQQNSASGLCLTNSYQRSYSQRTPVLVDGDIKSCSQNNTWKYIENGTELQNVKLISGSTNGLFHVAITKDNEIYTWGEGHSFFATKNNNNKITGEINKVVTGRDSIYALTNHNEVWEWEGSQGTPINLGITNVKDIEANDRTVLILKENGEVFGKGDNTYGQLGNKNVFGTNVTKLTKVADNITQIGLGFRHSLYFENTGKIFGQGWNSYRQLANEDDGVLEKFTKVSSLNNVNHVTANQYTTNAAKGNIMYSWGQLLGGDYGSTTNKPKQIKTFENEIMKLTGGPLQYTQNSILVNKDVYISGNLYRNTGTTIGNYRIGKLVHNPNNNAYRPNVVNDVTYIVDEVIPLKPDEIKLIDAVQGMFNGAAIDQTGMLISWGYNTNDLWGVGSPQRQDYANSSINSKGTSAFVKVKTDEKFTKVDGRYYTRIALHENKDVYSWGGNVSGSLGRTGNATYPLKIPGLENIIQISQGTNTGLALDDKGDIYAWGQGEVGQIGNGSTKNQYSPVKITGEVNEIFTYIHSGAKGMFAVSKNGDLYSWGDNRYGQLGLGDRVNRTSLRKVASFPSPVKQVGGGEEHTVVLLENGDVYVAGSDSYGQLGRDLPVNSVDYTEIPFPDYVTITSSDNEEKQFNDNLEIKGNVTSIVTNSDLKLTYEVEGSNGKVESGIIKEFKSKSTPEEFTKIINLGKKYTLGGYTVRIIVENKETNLKNSNSINFGILDKTPPTNPEIILSNTDWTNKDVKVTINDGVDNESGVNRTEYRINNEDWKTYNNALNVTKEGKSTIEARTYDNAGNVSSIVRKEIKIDKTLPTATIYPNIKETTHKNIKLTINAKDDLSGIKSITYLGENMVKDGNFKEETKYWKHSDGKYGFNNGVLNLKDNTKERNKVRQDDVFVSAALGEIYFSKVTARGQGVLNARFQIVSGEDFQVNYSKKIDDDEFKEYLIPMTRRPNTGRGFILERIGKEGWIEISNVELYSQKDLTNDPVLEVTKNGKYTFVIEDYAGNIITKDYEVTNIERKLSMSSPIVNDNAELTINEKMKYESPINNVIISDWRDELNTWKLTLEASQLSTLGKGIISINGISNVNFTEGENKGEQKYLKEETIIDNGYVEVASSINGRGIYELNFPNEALIINLSPEIVKKGIYNTKLTWTLQSTPDI